MNYRRPILTRFNVCKECASHLCLGNQPVTPKENAGKYQAPMSYHTKLKGYVNSFVGNREDKQYVGWVFKTYSLDY